jgi:hypothetical protein
MKSVETILALLSSGMEIDGVPQPRIVGFPWQIAGSMVMRSVKFMVTPA